MDEFTTEWLEGQNLLLAAMGAKVNSFSLKFIQAFRCLEKPEKTIFQELL